MLEDQHLAGDGTHAVLPTRRTGVDEAVEKVDDEADDEEFGGDEQGDRLHHGIVLALHR